MELKVDEQRALDGELGGARAFAMKVLVNLGELEGADRLVPVTSAHVSGVSYHTAGEALIKMLTELTEKGAKVSIPTSLNPAGMDLARWREMGYDPSFAEKQLRIIDLYSRLGLRMTCSCIPYELAGTVPQPKFGDHISWSESNAIIYANSVIGARTNRESGISSLASAIVGLTPNWGLHLDDARLPTVEVKVKGRMDHLHYDLLGAHFGRMYNSDILYIRTSGRKADTSDLKHLGATLAAKGGHGIFHLEGRTPEAGSIMRSRELGLVKETHTISPSDLEAEKDLLYPPPSRETDTFVLGCPHFGLTEFRRLHKAMKGRKLMKGKRVLVFTSKAMRERVPGKLLRDLAASGIEVYDDTCMVVTPLRSIGLDRLCTDSGKAAHYIPSSLNRTECGIMPMESVAEWTTL